MKKLLTALWVAGSMAITSSVCAQDYMKGVKAFEAKDYATAFKELKPIAEQGHGVAQIFVGMMYRYGMGVSQSYKEEYRWNSKAAEQGYSAAQFSLAWMFEYGQGVLQDNVYAHMWYSIAASNDTLPTSYLESRDSIAKKMTAADVSKAQELARECVKKQYKGC